MRPGRSPYRIERRDDGDLVGVDRADGGLQQRVHQGALAALELAHHDNSHSPRIELLLSSVEPSRQIRPLPLPRQGLAFVDGGDELPHIGLWPWPWGSGSGCAPRRRAPARARSLAPARLPVGLASGAGSGSGSLGSHGAGRLRRAQLLVCGFWVAPGQVVVAGRAEHGVVGVRASAVAAVDHLVSDPPQWGWGGGDHRGCLHGVRGTQPGRLGLLLVLRGLPGLGRGEHCRPAGHAPSRSVRRDLCLLIAEPDPAAERPGTTRRQGQPAAQDSPPSRPDRSPTGGPAIRPVPSAANPTPATLRFCSKCGTALRPSQPTESGAESGGSAPDLVAALPGPDRSPRPSRLPPQPATALSLAPGDHRGRPAVAVSGACLSLIGQGPGGLGQGQVLRRSRHPRGRRSGRLRRESAGVRCPGLRCRRARVRRRGRCLGDRLGRRDSLAPLDGCDGKPAAKGMVQVDLPGAAARSPPGRGRRTAGSRCEAPTAVPAERAARHVRRAMHRTAAQGQRALQQLTLDTGVPVTELLVAIGATYPARADAGQPFTALTSLVVLSRPH